MDSEVFGQMALLAEALTPLYELAEGQRAELERRGWSPLAAEAAASCLLNSLIVKCLEMS